MNLLDFGHLSDGYYEIREDLTLHIWDWRTPDEFRTKKWKKEGNYTIKVSDKDVEEIRKAYARGQIKTVNDLLDFVGVGA
ncbi:protein of unknown function (plasmid) [Thermococcus nautili]|uniref:hypothetical protein n=1 Tax=Thermococcus nautili TaxID=195522 RepID=UPI0025521DAD|nr:hypothetical protein [Thermococcus nautili]CAI1494278.1 protein of unknown function [Thermococcus nautili]